MKIDINGRSLDFNQGETILGVAKRNGIDIPTLCFDDRFKPYTSCFICIVKDNKNGKLIPSCSIKATDGMSIITDDDEIKKIRKMALELMLSEHDADCFSPCKTTCPAGIDIRDYILHSRTGEEMNGFMAVRKKNPLVTAVGRVCPAFCEADCSRTNIDDTVNIRLLKRYLGDSVYEKYYDDLLKIEKGMIQKANPIKSIAVVGGGPAGLSAAYYLTLAGHKVTIYECMPKLGGMLRYAIPCYRLPVDVLDREIESITRLGVDFKTSFVVDKENIQKLSKQHDAVLLAIGTWKETALGLDEKQYINIFPAVSFLKSVVENKIKSVGKKVIVIGGGNSAIDAARVSRRLGAEVNLIYRRTRKEMPALNIEVEDALNEGVKLFELMSPFELTAKSIKFRKMVISDEVDSSGRRKIKDTDEFVNFDFDTLVYAIGQKPEPELIDSMKALGLNNVYLCGDAKLGASTVIEAVADGRKTAEKIINKTSDELSFYSLREKGILFAAENKKVEKQKVSHLLASARIKNFSEVEGGYNSIVAVKESDRCINCGCTAVDECDLRKYSIDYDAQPNKYKHAMDKKKRFVTGAGHVFSDESLKYMTHEPSKCIKCGKCISVCSDVAGANALSFIGRGLGMVLSSNTENNISKSSCILCGMCIDSCPTGSLSESLQNTKWTGFIEELGECKGCFLKCKVQYGYNNGKIFRARSYDTPICSVGRWGWSKNYNDANDYYRGKITKNTEMGFDKTKIIDGEYLKKSDYIVSFTYNPFTDNPRTAYELNRLREKGVAVFMANSASSNIQGL
ncbi:MAG: FAD-dependent oxidoreductase [Proteobacteria bacterium]|nr:FAD-dependent oxidoreductase [Pseudomonadota bacterium]